MALGHPGGGSEALFLYKKMPKSCDFLVTGTVRLGGSSVLYVYNPDYKYELSIGQRGSGAFAGSSTGLLAPLGNVFNTHHAGAGTGTHTVNN